MNDRRFDHFQPPGNPAKLIEVLIFKELPRSKVSQTFKV